MYECQYAPRRYSLCNPSSAVDSVVARYDSEVLKNQFPCSHSMRNTSGLQQDMVSLKALRMRVACVCDVCSSCCCCGSVIKAVNSVTCCDHSTQSEGGLVKGGVDFVCD